MRANSVVEKFQQREFPSARTPEEAILAKLRLIDGEVRFSSQIPVELERLFPVCGLANGPSYCRDLPSHGLLENIDDSTFKMYLPRGLPEVRERFSIAHELIHSLLRMGIPPEELPVDLDHEEERLCNKGAAAILLPENVLLPRLQQLGPPLVEDVKCICDDFKVSLRTAIIRIVELQKGLDDWRCGFVEYHISDDGRRVKIGVEGQFLPGRYPLLSLTPKSQADVGEAYRTQRSIQGWTIFDFAHQGQRAVYCTHAPLRRADRTSSKIVSILYLGKSRPLKRRRDYPLFTRNPGKL